MAFNWTWCPTFFLHHRITLALGSAAIQWALNLALLRILWRLDRTAAWSLVPLQAWLSVAVSLTWCIRRDNPNEL
jgi:tryptophan-rich sensory protein